MNITLKNNLLYLQDYKLRCSIGKRGISINKKEGDGKTPCGNFKVKYILYRKDRIQNLKSKLKKKIIKKNMGWCDDPKSKYYNQLITFPFKYSAEKLWLKENTYDIILIIDYNSNPIIKNKGSAIFLHIAKKKNSPTKGCIATNKKNMRLLLSKINKKTTININ
jgi:L,D-peptidoglycan transpeptidase YkuD (ErfK/YbiS/YcfS/YnhG family)